METQDYGTSKSGASNNHIDIVYFFSNFHINKHIDVVKFSANGSDDQTLFCSFIESIGYKRISKLKLSKGNYLFKDTYKHDDYIAKVDVFHELKSVKSKEDGLPPFLVSIHDPNQELTDLLSSSCVYHGINLKVSKIELAYDFTGLSAIERIELFDFLKSHLFLKHSRSWPSERYVTTFYCNQIKMSSKGLKEYLRQDYYGQRILRLELTLKRQILNKLKINPSLKTIDSVDPFHFFTFMVLDENKLMNSLKWKSRKTHKCDKSRNKRLHDQLLERHVENYVNGFLLAPYPLMGKVFKLKSEYGVENYSRFLVPLKDFTQMFIEKTKDQTFLPSIIEN